MSTKYLYIDDEEVYTTEGIIAPLIGEELSIDVRLPTEFGSSQNFTEQIDELASSLNEYDGLILDWRLDIVADRAGGKASFRAGTIAQELRTRQTEGRFKQIPIVLLSTGDKLRDSFDTTSQDLFDEKYDKRVIASQSDQATRQLIGLAQGYNRITNEHSALQSCLGLDDKDYQLLDLRLIDAAENALKLPIHGTARFFLHQLIKRPGALVDEDTVAARLGIDKERSEDWHELLETAITATRYTGIFAEGWPRWWARQIEKQWWKSIAPSAPSLSRLKADERVQLIRNASGLLRLTVAEPIEPHYSTRYRTVCAVLCRPLDPIDGVTIHEMEPLPWQERRYISLHAALRRLGDDDGVQPHVSERARLNELRGSHSAS